MRTVNLGWLIVAAALLSAIGCGEGGPGTANLSAETEVKAESVSFHLLDLDGKAADLWQDGPAKATVLIFTQSDCPISNRYAPDIRALYDKFHPQGVNFYLVFVDPQQTPDAIRSHMSEYGYPCPALRDPEHSFAAFTGATVTPEAVVFDAQRQIVYRGRIDDLFVDFGKSRTVATTHDVAEAIEATLAGRPVAEPVTKAVGCYISDLQ